MKNLLIKLVKKYPFLLINYRKIKELFEDDPTDTAENFIYKNK